MFAAAPPTQQSQIKGKFPGQSPPGSPTSPWSQGAKRTPGSLGPLWRWLPGWLCRLLPPPWGPWHPPRSSSVLVRTAVLRLPGSMVFSTWACGRDVTMLGTMSPATLVLVEPITALGSTARSLAAGGSPWPTRHLYEKIRRMLDETMNACEHKYAWISQFLFDVVSVGHRSERKSMLQRLRTGAAGLSRFHVTGATPLASISAIL